MVETPYMPKRRWKIIAEGDGMTEQECKLMIHGNDQMSGDVEFVSIVEIDDDDEESIEHLQAQVRSVVTSMLFAAPEMMTTHLQRLIDAVPWPEGEKPGWSPQ